MRPTIFVLFGATGDVARRMVLPAFYGLASRGLLPDQWRLVGNGRGHMSDDGFRKEAYKALDDAGLFVSDDDNWKQFARHIRFAGSGFTEEDPGELMDVLRDLRHDFGSSYNLVHYLAAPPSTFEQFTRAIEAHGLTRNAKVVYEKPFGTSPEEFESLDRVVHDVFDESQVFCIDHFLGKEAAQSIHLARFSNSMFQSIWNRQHVEAVQIDVPETLDIVDRAEFYDRSGALLDMVMTHLFQLAAVVAMEPPASFGADDLLSARETVIDAFRPLGNDDIVFGQFDGYRDIEGVDKNSFTDTFVAARLWIETDRWRGVPFLLRTGKCLAKKAERVSLILRRPLEAPHQQPLDPAVVTFDLAGSGAIGFSTMVKKAGPLDELTVANTHIDLAHVSNEQPLAPYERLIHDVLMGDHARFTRSDGLRYAWRAIEAVLANRPAPTRYPRGSMGPAVADALAEPYGWLSTN